MQIAFHNDNFRFKTKGMFDGLTDEQLELLNSSSVTHSYKKGEIVFREGGIPSGIYFLLMGKIKKYKCTSNGGEQIFYVCSSGELLGYHALLSDEYYPDSAAALEDSEITFIPKETFLKVLDNSSLLSNRLLKALGHEFSVFINNITNLATKTVSERLALNLLILDEKFRIEENPEAPGEINMSRADLANMVGTAKETLVRLLQSFKKEELIEANGRSIHIVDRNGIMKEANLMGYHKRKV